MESKDSSRQDKTTESIELFQQGQYAEAEQGFIKCVALARQEGASPLEIAEALNNLSIASFALSKFTDTRKVLDEALALIQSQPTSDQSQTLRASCLNSQGRLFAEFEQFNEAEACMLEAIQISRVLHPVYAAEISGNLVRLCALIPPWRHKMKAAADDFESLNTLNEELEIYFDDLAGWRRPGNGWDRPGSAGPESLAVRTISYRALYLYESRHEAEADFESIIRVDEETKQVPPHMLAHAYASLAEIAFLSGQHQAAANYCEQLLKIAASSYLRDHPANFAYLLKAVSYSILSNPPEKNQHLYDQAEDLVRQKLGESTPYFARCLAARTVMKPLYCLTGGDLSKDQLIALHQCLTISRAFFADSHSWIIEISIFMSDILIRSNQLEEAEKLLTKIRADARNSFQSEAMECKCLKSLSDLRIKQQRISEAKDCVQKHEELLDLQHFNTSEVKVGALGVIGQQYMDAGLLQDADRVFRRAVVLAAPLRAALVQRANTQLALCLMRMGKTDEASEILAKPGDHPKTDSQQTNKRNELVEQSRLAWGMQTKKRFPEAKVLAQQVVNEAHLLMPESEEALLIALGVLIEQAKVANQADEILRLIGVLGDYKRSIRLRCVMPTLYLEAAQAYARQRSIKAEPLFEQAMQSAEEVQAFTPQVVDACCFAYMHHCTNTRNTEKGLQLCERLLKLRAASGGTASLPYAQSLVSKALLLADSDVHGADNISLQALEIMDNLQQKDNLQLFLALAVRSDLLKRLLRFDEGKDIDARMEKVRGEIEKMNAEQKAPKGA